MTDFSDLPGVTLMHPSEIREAEENPREIRPERFEALCYALDADPSMLAARPIIVDAKRGDVVCGNMRLRAARHLGWEQVPVFLHEFTSPAQRREWMVRDNQEYGDWVPDELSRLVSEHADSGADLQLLGFGEQELADLRRLTERGIDQPEPDAGEDPMPEVWGIVIDCDNEDQQAELLEEFADRGLKTRALMV